MIKLNLYNAWDYLNETAFEGELKRPAIMLYKYLVHRDTKGTKEDLAGGFDPKKGIYIGAFPHKTHLDVLETLFHEMCHQYVYELTCENPFQHGRLFCETYARGLEKLCQV